MKVIDNALSLMRLVYCRATGARVPLFAALGVTGRCNYRCVYCYGDYRDHSDDIMSTSDIVNIITSLKSLGTQIVNIIGGEPLVRDDIGVIVENVKSNNMICHLSSNASLIGSKIDLIKNIDVLDTSLDGTEENNDKSRGRGSYEKTMAGIECALSHGIKTNVNMVLTRHNTADVDSLILLASEMGFSISFNIAFDSHSASHGNYQDSLAIKCSDDMAVRAALRKIIDYKKRGYPVRFSEEAYDYVLNWPLPFDKSVLLPRDGWSKEDFSPIKCYFSRFHCYIDVDGNMYTCLHHKDDMPEVNVLDIGVESAWKRVSRIRYNCSGCYTICNNNANLIFGLNYKVLVSTIRDQIRQLYAE